MVKDWQGLQELSKLHGKNILKYNHEHCPHCDFQVYFITSGFKSLMLCLTLFSRSKLGDSHNWLVNQVFFLYTHCARNDVCFTSRASLCKAIYITDARDGST